MGTLLVGIVIGGTIMFFVEVRVVKYVSGTWEQSCADQRVYDYLQCLRAIDRGTTNHLDLVRFQNIGRMALTNYICEMEKLNADEHGAISGTNTSAYKVAKKYLATHTNSLPIGSDF